MSLSQSIKTRPAGILESLVAYDFKNSLSHQKQSSSWQAQNQYTIVILLEESDNSKTWIFEMFS